MTDPGWFSSLSTGSVAFFVHLLLLGSTADASHHRLYRNQDPVRTFDSTVLGNLLYGQQLADLQVPRGHLFTAAIEVGTPPQKMSCLLDSGTADIWLPSKRCKSCHDLQHFHTEESSTFMPAVERTAEGLLPVPVRASSSGGNVLGFLVQDTIELARHKFQNQSFIVVEEESMVKGRKWDGVCGLGFAQLSDANQPLYKNVRDGIAIFSLIPATGRFLKTPYKATYLTIGAFPHEDVVPTSLAWARAEPLEKGGKRSFWVVAGNVGVRSHSKDMQAWNSRLLIDTSTAYILVPRKYYRPLMTSLFSEEIFTKHCGIDQEAGNIVLCDCERTLDSGAMAGAQIDFAIGGKSFPIRAEDLFKKVPTKQGTQLCLLLMQQSPHAEVVIDPLALLAGLLAQQPEDASKLSGDNANANMKDGESMGAISLPLDAIAAPFDIPSSVGKGHEATRGRRKLAGNSGEQQPASFPMGFVAPNPMEDVWVLGGVFLEHFVTVFDFDNHRLAVALPSNSAGQDPSQGLFGDSKQDAQQVDSQVPFNGWGQHNPVEEGSVPNRKADNHAPTQTSSAGTFSNLFVILCFVGCFLGGVQIFSKTQQRKNVLRGMEDPDGFDDDPSCNLAE